MVFRIEPVTEEGVRGHRLRDTLRSLDAVFLPDLGMVGASLLHHGTQLLGRLDRLAGYATHGWTAGIPLLHPWANRLAAFAYRVGGRSVAFDASSPVLHLDDHGLPMHGVLAGRLRWVVTRVEATSEGATLTATMRWGEDRDMDTVFPFPHELSVEVTLAADGLTIRTTLVPTGDAAVPVAFGWHPYFQLPGVPRREWKTTFPAMRRLVLDSQKIPTGADEPFAPASEPLGARDLDDGFVDLPQPATFVVAGGSRRITVTFLAGYPCAQVFAPAGRDLIAIEPMTAPTNALVTGYGLRLAPPGNAFTAAFRIAVADR